ncbi:MAG TPA: hypothetical protein VMI06_16765 [Terriglobia bacterium]|nr:hypothetical protein [Terriglobia bacterium]
MTPEEIRKFIEGGEWASITTELRPSANKAPTGEPQPFFCSRVFRYSAPDRFECTVMNYADANGKVPLVKIDIAGHNVWDGPHPIADGAYNLNYVADEAYKVTPLHGGFAAVANRFPAPGLNAWEAGETQDVKGKAFPLFGLFEGQIYVDYDLIYITSGMLFNGSKHVDGRAFDKPENRPTNLQIPLVRK